MIPRIDVSALAVPEGKSVQEMVAIYKNNKNVVFAEPNYFATITWLPDDPYYAACQTALKIMSPEPAWSISTGSPAVPVAILDTGATFNHEDLSGKYLLGYDFVNNDNDPTDDQGHGTMVSGIIGANTNNSLGIAGAAGSASLLPVKVMDNNGSGTWSNVALGIIFAADKGAKVINMSLGGPTDSSTVKSAVDYAYNKGVVLVASAGNSNSAVEYPAAYPNVISVSAVDNYDEKAGFSNYGPEVDFTAPGYSIYTTKYNSSYCFGSGTSFSAPFVSALAELIMTVIPGCTPAQVVDIMKQGAKDLGTPGWDCYYGYGRVDYAAALSIAAGQTPVEDTTKPVITLNGSPSVTITAGETYIDAGAAAVDNIDGDITSKIVVNNTVNTSIPGTYIVTYNVADAAGNQADQVTRTVRSLNRHQLQLN